MSTWERFSNKKVRFFTATTEASDAISRCIDKRKLCACTTATYVYPYVYIYIEHVCASILVCLKNLNTAYHSCAVNLLRCLAPYEEEST